MEGQISSKLQDEKEMVLVSVTRNGYNIEDLSDHWKDDKEVALKAVTNKPLALHSVSERLKDDKDVVLAAVSHDFTGFAIEDVSMRLRNDKEVILAAMKANIDTLEQASMDIQIICDDLNPITRLEEAVKFEKVSANMNGLKEKLKPKGMDELPRRKMKI